MAYWIVAGLLALLYLYSGGLKVLRTPDQLRPMIGWVDTVPLRLLRTIGVLEVLGALGLILPPLTGIAPVLAERRPARARWGRDLAGDRLAVRRCWETFHADLAAARRPAR